MIRMLIFTVLMAVITTSSLAQTAAERAACTGDAKRLCRYALAGTPFTVVSCLAANKAKISAQCRAVLTAHGQ